MYTQEQLKRWSILDKALAEDTPVTPEDIFIRWHQNGILPKWGDTKAGLRDQYSLTFRQDLVKLSEIYTRSGLKDKDYPDMLTKGKGKGHGKTYAYSRGSQFSMMSIIREQSSKSDWEELDRQLDRLSKELPSSIAGKVDFLVRSRTDFLRGKNCFVDWSEPIGVDGYTLLPDIYRYTRSRTPIRLQYGESMKTMVIHPYLLKSYRGRWYCFGLNDSEQKLFTLNLGKIHPGTIMPANISFKEYDGDIDENGRIKYFDSIIGVTKSNFDKKSNDYLVSEEEREILIGVHNSRSFYYLTSRPIHLSQTVTETFDKERSYGQLKIKVITNTELFMNLLYQGPSIEVEAPEREREIMKKMIEEMAGRYK